MSHGHLVLFANLVVRKELLSRWLFLFTGRSSCLLCTSEAPLHGVPEVRLFEIFCPAVKKEYLVHFANTELPGQLVERIISAVPGPNDGTAMVTAMVSMPPGINTVTAAAAAAGFVDLQFPDGGKAVISFTDKPLPGGPAQQKKRQRT